MITTARRARALLLAVLVALATGCAPSGPTEEELVDMRAELAARPSLEEAVARYEQMQQLIRDRLDTEIGPFDWRTVLEGSEGGCGFLFPDMGGTSLGLPAWGFDAGIPDADWPRAKQIITEITTGYGFDTPTLQIDQPGRHRTTSADTTLGAQFIFSAEGLSTMQVTTGCHLRAADRPATGTVG